MSIIALAALLPSSARLTAFVLASTVLAVTPGPGVVYVVTRTLAQGRRAGLLSVAGVALGNVGNALGAAFGLSALFAVSALAFDVVKYAGAAYLMWLGFQAFRQQSANGSANANTKANSLSRSPHSLAPAAGRLFRNGVVVALLNPKTALFFAAFLPQFMNPAAPALPQSVLLGALFAVIAFATDSAYVLAAARLAPRLAGGKFSARKVRRITGSVFVGLGLFTAVTGSRVTPR